jgi:cytidylate kinase
LSGGSSAPIVVAIDGPAGVGKSAVARALAQALQLPYLDTGAMYRALAWKALRDGVDPDDPDAAQRLVGGSRLELRPLPDGAVAIDLDGDPVEPHIRSLEVGALASRVAALPALRAWLVDQQRAFGRLHGAVMEGRDIGTVVFPETPFKFFLDARPEVRVARRGEQLRAAGEPARDEEVRSELESRDRRDRERAHSPLAWDPSYQRVDTSDLTREQVIERLVSAVRSRVGC